MLQADDTGEIARGDLEFGTTARLLAIAASRHGQRVAIEDGEETLTFDALTAVVRTGARALMARGIERGDRVAIWAPNRWEWIAAALAIQAVGGILVPINTRFKGPEAAYILRRSGARALFTVGDFLGVDYLAALADAGEALADLKTRVVFDAGHGSRHDALSWSALLRDAERVTDSDAAARADAVSPEDVSDLIFTSGTTGRPKGVMATHAQSLRAFRDWSAIAGLRAGDRYLVVPPFFHTFGYKAGFLACLMMGATVLPQAVFDADAVLRRIVRDRVSVLPGPPTLYQTLLAGRSNAASADGSSGAALRLAVTGAAVIPVELVHRMHRDLGFETVLTAYGLTEATGVSTMCRRGDDAETIATTSGRAVPGVRVRAVDDAGKNVAPGQAGEILVSGYTVMKGYFEDPEATAAAIDPDGWLHTGDIGVLDARGNVRITDRKKDMFIVGGFNAYPAEIEQSLMRHDAIAQVAVVGVADDRLGEVGMAFVVLRPGASASEAELLAWSRANMANYKVPRGFSAVTSLPMNASGKVLKHVLRERARAGNP